MGIDFTDEPHVGCGMLMENTLLCFNKKLILQQHPEKLKISPRETNRSHSTQYIIDTNLEYGCVDLY